MLKKHNKFVPDPSINLEIDGVVPKIFPVETRNNISQKLQSRSDGQDDDSKKKKPIKKIKKVEDLVKTDPHGKRRLDLALLGKWRAEEGMNKFDYEKFKAHEKEKVQKLKNPNNSISSTRIVMKNLDKSLSENQIKEFCENYLSERGENSKHLTYVIWL